MKFFPIALIAIISLILIAGCTQQPPTGGTTTTGNGSTPGSDNGDVIIKAETFTVSINSSGFGTTNLSIAKGDRVKFVNQDSSPHWPASTPHPVHTDLAGFDARHGLSQGESYSFTFTKTGTFGFHDHLNPSQTGAITVTG